MIYQYVGHELDKEAKIWTSNNNQYYIWGAAGKGTTFIQRYSSKLNIKAVVDKDEKKQGQELLGVKIISPEDLQITGGKIVICTEAYREVAKQLDEHGLLENVDYIDFKRFD